MIRITFIPDGLSELPVEAKDDSILSTKLKECDAASDGSPTWCEIVRTVHNQRLTLELPGSFDEFDENCLGAFADSVAEIDGLKRHPNGWVEVEDSDDQS